MTTVSRERPLGPRRRPRHAQEVAAQNLTDIRRGIAVVEHQPGRLGDLLRLGAGGVGLFRLARLRPEIAVAEHGLAGGSQVADSLTPLMPINPPDPRRLGPGRP